MRILFADAIDERGAQALRDLGHEVEINAGLTAANLSEHVDGVDILVVRSTKVTAETVAAGKSLSLIVRAGAGTDNIDKTAASAHGIYVCNVPGRNAVAVAELTMGLLLAVDRRIADNTADLRSGQWNKGLYSKADGILGRNLAIFGLGDIGMATATRARGFGMTVHALDRPNRSAATVRACSELSIVLHPTQEALLAHADVVSIHVPKANATIGMVDETFLGQMKPGAILLNTSRGEVVDEAALIQAMNDKGIRAGLDVYRDEPGGKSGTFTSALAQHPNVVGTHHIGASTAQAQESVADGTIEVITGFLNGHVINSVNLDLSRGGTSCVVIRHLDRVGVLAKIFAVLRAGRHNVQQMANQVFDGGNAAVATIHITGNSDDQLLDELEAIDEVLAASVMAAP